MTDSPLLILDNVTVSYGKARGIEDVSIALPEGARATLVGPNGAGKTTLLSAICGLRRLSKGEIRVGGEALNGAVPARSVALGVALVPEGRHVFAGLSVDDNLLVAALGVRAASTGFLSGAFRLRRARLEVQRDRNDVFDLMPKLAALRGRPAGRLSGGEQQMLAIGRALMARPRLLMIDELSLGLAPNLTADLLSYLERLNKERGITVVLVEQNVRRALEFADVAFVLSNGRLSATGDPRAAITADAVESAFLGAAT